MNYALPASIRERLLSEAVLRHELAASALPAIQDLLRHGLSFEQALVGTGLISVNVFSEWMHGVSALPVLSPKNDGSVLPAGLEFDTVFAWRVIPQKTGSKNWTMGLTNPWDQEVRTALEALAAEHGWNLSFAVVLPSVADRWLRSMNQGNASSNALRRYARSLVERTEREPSVIPTQIPQAWFPALSGRLSRRSDWMNIQVRHDAKAREPWLELRRQAAQRVFGGSLQVSEHPVRDWSSSLEGFFDEGKLVFLIDLEGGLLPAWPDRHVPQEAHEDWRSAPKRWMALSDASKQEELFHLALSGYPGTVCFSSPRTLKDWERAADEAGVSYAACIGHETGHGIAWSVYST